MIVRMFRSSTPHFMVSIVGMVLLSACSETAFTVKDHVQATVTNTVSGALAPVRVAIDEAARRAEELGEGVNEVKSGVKKVRGALSGSGSTW